MLRLFLVSYLLLISLNAAAAVKAGTASVDITPPLGTPSAGYEARKGKGMEGIHDPLLANVLYIDNGTKKIAFCAVDNLGFDISMSMEIRKKVGAHEQFKDCDIYISSSHTHSGGGAFLNIPGLGEALSGKFDPKVRQFYIDSVVDAIVKAEANTQEVLVGFGTVKMEGVQYFRAPFAYTPPSNLNIIKVTDLNGQPLAVLFNYALHPTTLKADNMQFSADFVGKARALIIENLGKQVVPLFINGAQAELIPVDDNHSQWEQCDRIGKELADAVLKIWSETEAQEELDIQTVHKSYAIAVKPNPFGMKIPMEFYPSELNMIIFNGEHVIVTIPGELSVFYEDKIAKMFAELNYKNIFIFGLTNDAHGYILTPEAWRAKTKESALSFGGEMYGEELFQKVQAMIQQ